MNDFETIARQVINSILHNTLNTRTVNVFFHRSPGHDNGGDRAIPGLDYQVRAQSFIIQRGRTGNDGKVAMSIRGPSSTLELLFGGNVVARYEVSATTAALSAVGTVVGQKQRLRLLGYQLGHRGPQGNGVDGNNDFNFERSMLDFQADSNVVADHRGPAGTGPTAATTTPLTNQAGA